DRHGVPDPVGELRALVAAGGGAARGAVRAARRARRRARARDDQRRLLPDRPRDPDRPRRQERDPDRRVRAAERGPGHVALRRRDRGGAPALPPDRDDLARLRARRRAAGGRHRRRRRRAPVDGHGRVRRHARGDLHRDAVRAVVLHRARRPAEEAPGAPAGASRRDPRMTRRLVPALAAAALLAGCMVGPDYERPTMELPAAYPGAQAAPAQASAQTPAEARVPADWWKLYGDPLLDDLVASALERNADIRQAVARIEESDANLREANAAFLPEIDAQGNAGRSRASTTTGLIPPGVPSIRTDIRLALTTAFELDFWGRLRRGVEALRAQALASRYARDVVALTLSGLTAQAYFGVRSLDAQLIVTRETLAN